MDKGGHWRSKKVTKSELIGNTGNSKPRPEGGSSTRRFRLLSLLEDEEVALSLLIQLKVLHEWFKRQQKIGIEIVVFRKIDVFSRELCDCFAGLPERQHDEVSILAFDSVKCERAAIAWDGFIVWDRDGAHQSQVLAGLRNWHHSLPDSCNHDALPSPIRCNSEISILSARRIEQPDVLQVEAAPKTCGILLVVVGENPLNTTPQNDRRRLVPLDP